MKECPADEKNLDIIRGLGYTIKAVMKFIVGPVAQLGERSVRIREVKGSNPSRSTTLGRRLWISHSDAKLWDTPVNNGGVPLPCAHF